MVCSENYFSTATRVDSCGALSISRHLADLVITYAGQTGLTGQATTDRGRPITPLKCQAALCLPTTLGPDDR